MSPKSRGVATQGKVAAMAAADATSDRGAAARRLMRGRDRAALATILAVAEAAGLKEFQHSFYNLRWGLAAEALNR